MIKLQVLAAAAAAVADMRLPVHISGACRCVAVPTCACMIVQTCYLARRLGHQLTAVCCHHSQDYVSLWQCMPLYTDLLTAVNLLIRLATVCHLCLFEHPFLKYCIASLGWISIHVPQGSLICTAW